MQKETTLELKYDFETYERMFNEAIALMDRLIETTKELDALCIHLGNEYTRKHATDKLFGSYHMDSHGRRDAVKALQEEAWTSIIKHTNIRMLMPESMQREFDSFLKKQHDVPFTALNMNAILQNLYDNRGNIAMKLVYDVHQRMCGYYKDSKYKTNNKWTVQENVILSNMCSYGYKNTFSLPHYFSESIYDIDKALCALSGKKMDDIRKLGSAIQETPKYGNGKGECEFFTFTLYKNGNAHLKWKDNDLRRMFNQAAAEQHEKELAKH